MKGSFMCASQAQLKDIFRNRHAILPNNLVYIFSLLAIGNTFSICYNIVNNSRILPKSSNFIAYLRREKNLVIKMNMRFLDDLYVCTRCGGNHIRDKLIPTFQRTRNIFLKLFYVNNCCQRTFNSDTLFAILFYCSNYRWLSTEVRYDQSDAFGNGKNNKNKILLKVLCFC